MKGEEKDKTEEIKETKIEKKEEAPKDLVKASEKEVEKIEQGGAKKKKTAVIILIGIIVLFILSTIFAILNMNNTKIINGVFIQGVEISKMTQEEAKTKLTDIMKENKAKEINIKHQEFSKTINEEQLEIEADIEKAVTNAYKKGRSNNIIVDNFQILKAAILKEKIQIEITYNEQLLEDLVNEIEQDLPGKVEQYSYEIEEDTLKIKKGTAGIQFKKDELKEEIIKSIKQNIFNEEEITIDIKTYYTEPKKIDIKKIHDEIYKEPQDAYIVEDPFEVHVEQNGVDFDISLDEAKELIKEEKNEYEIPLKREKAQKTVSDLGNSIFKETLAKYTTNYGSSNANRASNIELAAETINGYILKPGEIFSYNKVLGNTTKAKGYKLAGAYSGGQVIEAYGGGICQVSTTLYNVALYANLEIVERYNHTYAVSYVPAGRDATVSYGGKDFKFKNNRTYPVKIEAHAGNGTISISLKGIKEKDEYEVILQSKVLSKTPCSVVYQETDSLPEGKEKVIQTGYNGYKSITYKTLKLNGEVISTTTLSSDTYEPMSKIVQIGTKKEQKAQPKEEPVETVQEEISTPAAEVQEVQGEAQITE